MTLVLGTVVLVAGIYAIYRRVDVRLALLLTALVLGVLAEKPMAIVQMFLQTFANERFVVPICTAMGFAYVLKLTACDRHLVHLLVKPLTHVRGLLVPGTVVVGFLVNIPVVSQTSTAVTLGAVVIPILVAARVPALVIGSALLLGSSMGGELLNPGAPELRTVVEESAKAAHTAGREMAGQTEALVERLLPLNLLGLLVGTTVFWWRSWRCPPSETPAAEVSATEATCRINYFKALIPVLPLVLLFLTAPPFKLLQVPMDWLVDKELAGRLTAAERHGLFDCRLIGAAMLIGVLAAALSAPRTSLKAASSFFEGAGYGFANIISLIVTATCFGKAVEVIGFAALLGRGIEAMPVVLVPAAGALPLAFGVLCGSGMASTQSLFGFFAGPAVQLNMDPYLVGAIVALASAAGRTMSPFAAVTLMSATMTKTEPLQLAARVAPPLLAAVAVEVIVAMLLMPWR